MKSNMSPIFSASNKANQWLRNIIFSGQGSLANAREVFASNFYDLFLCKFGLWMIAASCVIQSALVLGIACIVLLGADKQMARIYALPIITMMANTQRLRDSAGVKEPRKAMSENHLFVHHEVSVSVNRCPIPVPTRTRIGFGHLVFIAVQQFQFTNRLDGYYDFSHSTFWVGENVNAIQKT